MYKSINERIKHFINLEKINQSEFAFRIQVKPQTISNMLMRKSFPSYKVIAAILKAYVNIDARWLILGEGYPYNDVDPSLIEEPKKDNYQTQVEHLKGENELLRELLHSKNQTIGLMQIQLAAQSK